MPVSPVGGYLPVFHEGLQSGGASYGNKIYPEYMMSCDLPV